MVRVKNTKRRCSNSNDISNIPNKKKKTEITTAMLHEHDVHMIDVMMDTLRAYQPFTRLVCNVMAELYPESDTIRIPMRAMRALQDACHLYIKQFLERTFACPLNTESIMSLRNITSANAVQHACEYCGRNFRFPSNLAVHRRTHEGRANPPALLPGAGPVLKSHGYIIRPLKMVRVKNTKRRCSNSNDVSNIPDKKKKTEITTAMLPEHDVNMIDVMMDTLNEFQPFTRLVCNVIAELYPERNSIRIQVQALEALQEASIMYIKQFLEDSFACALRITSANAVQLACEYCGRNFRFPSNLAIHRRTHEGQANPPALLPGAGPVLKSHGCPFCRMIHASSPLE